MYGWYWEELEFAKLATIQRWNKMRKGWYQEDYYDKIVNTDKRRDVKKDEGGMIDNVGVSMNKEEFELYKQVFEKLNLFEAIHTEQVMPHSSWTRFLIACPISRGVPSNFCAPVISINASSSESGSTYGVKDWNISITLAEISE